MATSITAHQKREATAGVYRVTTTITLVAGGIPEELFVFSYADDSYQHVANLSDIHDYPTTPTVGYDYYRLAEAVLDFDDVSDAAESATAILARLQELVNDYEAAKTAFIGEEDTVITDA